jgi:hypothetical protein
MARRLHQFSLGPGIILDGFSQEPVNWESMYKYLSCWSEAQILESLEVVVQLFDKSAEQIREQILQFEWVAPDYFDGKVVEEMFTETRIRRCINNVCRHYKLEFPAAFRRRLVRVMLDQELEAYDRGEVEDEDFLHSFNIICGEETDVQETALTYVSEMAGPLGHYLMEMKRPTVLGDGLGLSKRQLCQQPYNRALHRIGGECGEPRVVQDEGEMNRFAVELRGSTHVTVLVHAPPRLISATDEIDLLTVRTKRRIFVFLPKVFPQTLEPLGKALNECAMDQVVFTHKGDKMKSFCKEVLQWGPKNIIDVHEIVLRKGWGKGDTMDDISEKVLGGRFCRRAWRFDAVTVPSSTALEHRKIHASLIHEFGLQMVGNGDV